MATLTQPRSSRKEGQKTGSPEPIVRFQGRDGCIPEAIAACVHALVKRTVVERPSAVAVRAWDGDLTYHQLDQLSSRLARKLADFGVVTNTVVPICFDKSKFFPVAALAVMKAGAASFPLSISEPVEHILHAISKVSAPLLLASKSLALPASEHIKTKLVIVDEDLLFNSISFSHTLPIVTPLNIACVISTADGHDDTILHQNLSSAILYQQTSVGFNSTRCVLDLSGSWNSYLAWYTMFQTLTSGGTFCIPRHAVGQQNIKDCVTQLQANFTCLTPSISQTLDLYALDDVMEISFIGESRIPYIMNDQGMLTTMPDEYEMTAGARTWVIDINDPESLASAGSIGELCIEGPLVGPGYVDPVPEILSAFEQYPPWLPSNLWVDSQVRGRVHRTGDLVQCLNGGRLVFVGRKFTPRRMQSIESLCSQSSETASTAATSQSEFEPRVLESETEKSLQTAWAEALGISPKQIATVDDNFFHLGGNALNAIKACRLAQDQGLNVSVRDLFRYPSISELATFVDAQNVQDLPEDIRPFTLLKSCQDEKEVQDAAAQLCRVSGAQVVDVLPCTPLQEGLLAMTAKNGGGYIMTHVLELNTSVEIQTLKRAWAQAAAMNSILRTRIVSLPGHGMVQVILEEGLFWDEEPHDVDLESFLERKSEKHGMGLGLPLTRLTLVEDGSHRRYLIWQIHHALYDGWSMPLLLNDVEQAYDGRTGPKLGSMHQLIKSVSRLDEAAKKSFWQSQFANSLDVCFPAAQSPTYQAQPDLQMQRTVTDVEWKNSDFTPSTIIRAAWAVVAAHNTNVDEAVFGATVTGRQAMIPGIEKIVGPAIATVPIRISLDWEDGVNHLLNSVQRQSAEMIPFEQTGLQNIRRFGEHAASACNFQTLLVVQPYEHKESHQSSDGIFVEAPAEPDHPGIDDTWKDFSTFGIVIICQLEAEGVALRISYDSNLISEVDMRRTAAKFASVIRQLSRSENGDQQLKLAAGVQQWGLREIWDWNATVPEPLEACVQDLIKDRADERPNAPAVCAWDGDFTYGELDLLSTQLAYQLVGKGVRAGVTVPLCFEKSKWMPVAACAVMKCGAASVALDTTQPEERLNVIASQVGELTVILSSTENERLACHLVGSGDVVIVGDNQRFTHRRNYSSLSLGLLKLPETNPDDLLYVVFTSGTTGMPKGAMVSHRNFCSAIKYQQRPLGFDENSRVFDFASYAFDAAWCNLLHALTRGGCVCIPSALERQNELAESFAKYQVTTADLTPSVARFLGPKHLSQLKTLILGGEAVLPSDGQLAGENTQIINVYGPAECTPTVTFADVPADATGITIGRGAGVCTWVVDVDNPDELAPLGSVGELWVEGPLVGLGYLNNPEKTATAFVPDPAWLLRGAPGHAGRRGTLYRTGDLVRYLSDGTMAYVGRKDTQVKIRGQRVELGEIEHHVQRAIETTGSGFQNVQVVVETVKPQVGTVLVLVAFISLDLSDATEKAHDETVRKIASGLPDKLGETLPVFMVPSSFIPMQTVPRAPTGKADRRKLREVGESSWLQYRGDMADKSEETESLTDMEKLLQSVWMSVLNLSAQETSVNKSFMRLGGDSITAMQVVSQCRLQSVSLTVSDVLQAGTIRKLASRCQVIPGNGAVVELEEEGVEEDPLAVFDLSPIQQMFFDTYPDGLDHYNQSFMLELSRFVRPEDLLAALRALVSRHAMLRARFQKDGESGVWRQCSAPDDENAFVYSEHVTNNMEEVGRKSQWRQENLDLRCGPVFACDLFRLPASGRQVVMLSAHHAVIDLVSWRNLWSDLEEHITVGEIQSQIPVSFQRWTKLQARVARTMSPLTALPFPLPKSEVDFWGLPLSENTFSNCDSYTDEFDKSLSSKLFGDCNESMRTETLDILVAALAHSFQSVFPERSVPSIWLEGHGREQSENFPLDMSGTIGWFTTLHPIPVPVTSAMSLIEAIRLTKDMRRSVPNKGQPYFACSYHSKSGREAFQGHEVAEIIFNFTGSFQQLERDEGLFKRVEDEGVALKEVSGLSRRTSMIEVNGDVEDGELVITFQYHQGMKHKDRLLQWCQKFFDTVRLAIDTLADMPVRLTKSDLPLLPLTYSGIDSLLNEQLPSLGLNCDAVADMYPCSPLQEGILLSTLKGSASYATSSVWKCVPTKPTVQVSAAKLIAAWRSVVRRHTMLSTLFTLHPDGKGFIQIVAPGSSVRVEQLDTDLDCPTEALWRLGKRRFSPTETKHAFIVSKSRSGEVACRLDISHALIDGVSMSVIVQEIIAAYDDLSLPSPPPFSKMVQYIESTPRAQKLASWAALLDGVRPCDFPVTSPPAGATVEEKHGFVTIPASLAPAVVEFCKHMGITRAVFLQVAWAMLLSQFTGSKEVCFGYIASGRDAPLDGVDAIIGPLANLLVSRIDLESSPQQVLETTSQNSMKHLSIQHTSLAEIQHRLGLSGQRLFNTCLSIREADRFSGEEERSISFESHDGDDPHEYDLALSAIIKKDNIEVVIEFREPYVSQQVAKEAGDIYVNAIKYLLQAEAGPWTASVTEIGEFHAKDSLFSGFFKRNVGVDEEATRTFWTSQFEKIEGAHFPLLKTATYSPEPHIGATRTFKDLQWDDSKIDGASLVRAAWSIVTARILGSNEALFGNMVREESTCLIVPVRVPVNWESNAQEFLQQVQGQTETMKSFSRAGLQRIRHMSEEAATGCGFQTLLVIQDADEERLVSQDHYPLVVHCQLGHRSLEVHASHDTSVLGAGEVDRIISQVGGLVQRLLKTGEKDVRLRDLAGAGQQDLQTIWAWNKKVPKAVETCMHDLISQKAQHQPAAPAICAWEGELTYRELDQLSSKLALKLVGNGVKPGVIIPLFFEKSLFMPVAALAVMKAGGICAPVDVAQPGERLSAIVEQVGSQIVLSSAGSEGLARRSGGKKILIINKKELLAPFKGHRRTASLPVVKPSGVLYIVFTSGSTGTPKGVMITHTNMSSALAYQRQALGYTSTSRVMDFASYAFDVAWSNLLNTLTVGACMCIPSIAERQDNLSGCLEKYRVTLADLTPSIARHLDPGALSKLSTLLLGGEVVLPSDALLPGRDTRVIGAYGPAECTPTSTLLDLSVTTEGIGRGHGLNTWVVDAENPQVLAAVGAIGELWLEGPLVGKGYLNNPSKTSAAFVENPAWLSRGVPESGIPGRHGLLYKTGDLVRYMEDGTLAFIGRKDTQVKIRGQRVELEEVEHLVRKAIDLEGVQVVAEAIQPQGAGSKILAAFVALPDADNMTEDAHKNAVRAVTSGIASRLAASVPVYMVPTVFVPVKQVPQTATGKVDRRRLISQGSALTTQQIAALSRTEGERRPPKTESEKVVQALWAEVLQISSDNIGVDDNFFRIGGDSIGAIRLVGLARQKGLKMSVGEIFTMPVLRDIAEASGISYPPTPETTFDSD